MNLSKLKNWIRRKLSPCFGCSADGRDWGRVVAAHEKGTKK